MAIAMAMAMAVIRPEHAGRGGPPRESIFLEKCNLILFWSFLDLLDLRNGSGSKFCIGPCRFHVKWRPWSDFMNKNVRKSTNTLENVTLYDKTLSIFENLTICLAPYNTWIQVVQVVVTRANIAICCDSIILVRFSLSIFLDGCERGQETAGGQVSRQSLARTHQQK